MIAIKNPEFLNIRDDNGESRTGGNQEWYAETWHRMAGCGPVAASNLVWYRARAGESRLCEVGDAGRRDFVRLMDDMFSYITPGKGGVHSSGLFIPGLLAYCAGRGVTMASECLEVPRKPRCSPALSEMRDFLAAWLERDCPVAFLNLSNGSLPLPDSWHWTTILSLAPESMTALISDEGRTYEADLALWLETSILGGCFVVLHGE